MSWLTVPLTSRELTSLRIWVIVPLIVSVILGRFITRNLQRDLASEIAYREWADLQVETEAETETTDLTETTEDQAHSIQPDGLESPVNDIKLLNESFAPTSTSRKASPASGVASRANEPQVDRPNGTAAAYSSAKSFSSPQGGAALPITFTPRHLPVLVVGSNRLAASRVCTLMEADADVYIASSSALSESHEEVQYRVKRSEARYVQLHPLDMQDWAIYLSKTNIALVCITDTLIGSTHRRSAESVEMISKACIALHIPVNVSDYPAFSTFSFPSVHRFAGIDGGMSNLQVAVSTNGHGCRLSGRIRREIVSKLPTNVGAAVDNVGKLRARAKKAATTKVSEVDFDKPLNSPVPQLDTPSLLNRASMDLSLSKISKQEQQLRRMRWVQQMSEYYSYEALSRMTSSEMERALSTWDGESQSLPHHDAMTEKPRSSGRIFLVGSGPGHPGLLTVAARQALKTATVIFSDKLVPTEILALVPSSSKLHIAKKFPGNNEGAQNEMMEQALEGARSGETVVRLKQGDPFVYGRGGEEVLYFRENGFEATVIPGISSALAGPLIMGIPVTQRGVAESLVICTGVGRRGKAVQLPGYIKSRTLVVLMGVARIDTIVSVLTDTISSGRDGEVYPLHLPIAIIERASSPDQRIITSTISAIGDAVKSMEERPPGMMVIGWAVLCLEGDGKVDLLDGANENEVVKEWMAPEAWKTKTGLSPVWDELLNTMSDT